MNFSTETGTTRRYTKTGDLTNHKEAVLTLLPLYSPRCSVVQWNHGIVGLAVGNGGFYVKTSHPKPHYRPLSEIVPGESNSISNQKRILEAYAKQNGFTNLRWYTDV